MNDNAESKRHTRVKLFVINGFFVIICILILVFLLRAPEETTSPLPQDEIHGDFYKIESKKEAEKTCLDCHGEGKDSPLLEGHPPKYRCLFCHKRISLSN